MTDSGMPPLSDLENTVMTVIWELGHATAEQVRMALEDAQPMKDSTTRTILRRLEQKGYVRHEIEGRTYVYSPTVGSRSVAADAVRGIIDRFCNGSVEDLLVGMVDREVVSPEKLRLLAQRIARSTEQADAKGRRKARRRYRKE